MPRWDFAHVQNDLNSHILRMLEDTFFFFLLKAAHVTRARHAIIGLAIDGQRRP